MDQAAVDVERRENNALASFAFFFSAKIEKIWSRAKRRSARHAEEEREMKIGPYLDRNAVWRIDLFLEITLKKCNFSFER